MILAIDPGLYKCGVAAFSPGGILYYAATVKRKREIRAFHGEALGWATMAHAISPELNPWDVASLVIERMQVDARTLGKTRALLELSGVVGAISYRFRTSEIVSPTPREWKGSIPKDVMKARLKETLSPRELETVRKGATHDTWDAIGLGLWYLKLKRIRE